MDNPSIDELGERLGIVLREPEAIRQAFIHSSFHNENPDLVAGHNERLEFYGDAVIGIVVSRLLYDRFPAEDEGLLTARRASLVNRDALAEVALDLGLDRYLQLGRGEAECGGATRPSLLAAAFEALAGAISLTEGPQATTTVLAGLFSPRIEAAGDTAGPPKSAKSRLQEWSQHHRQTKPVYELLGTSGPPHDQRFEVVVGLAGIRLGRGEGSSRQRAEEHAAAAALADLPQALDADAAAL